MIATYKIESRREVVAASYERLMVWAKKVGIVPADTSGEIGDYHNLPADEFAAIQAYGFPVIVAEYKGLTDALKIMTQ